MSRPALLLLTAAASALAGCLGNNVVDCTPGSETWKGGGSSAAALVCSLKAVIAGPPTTDPNSIQPTVTISDACAECVAKECNASALACLDADGGACSQSEPAYAALTSCISASCSAPCPGVP
jgi:hypothetical protein